MNGRVERVGVCCCEFFLSPFCCFPKSSVTRISATNSRRAMVCDQASEHISLRRRTHTQLFVSRRWRRRQRLAPLACSPNSISYRISIKHLFDFKFSHFPTFSVCLHWIVAAAVTSSTSACVSRWYREVHKPTEMSYNLADTVEAATASCKKRIPEIDKVFHSPWGLSKVENEKLSQFLFHFSSRFAYTRCWGWAKKKVAMQRDIAK